MAASEGHSRLNDVIVVGGGLIGCSIALRLAQAKLRVSIFERNEPGCEASSAGAGMIAPQGETVEPDGFYDLCAASRDLYPAFSAEIEELSGQAVGFQPEGTLIAAFDEEQDRCLDRIYEGQRKAGLPIERITAQEATQRVPHLSPEIRGALLMASDFRVDNELLVLALAEACWKAGVMFHTHSMITGFIARNGRIEGVEARENQTLAGSSHKAGTFILAAGAWSAEVAASIGVSIPVIPCRGQLVEFEGVADFPLAVRAGHHYLVPRSDGRLVAGSNMEYVGFEKAVTGEGLRSILEAAERIAPIVKKLRFRRAWAGFRPDTLDHRPILGYGRFPNLVFATGHFRNGILLTPITAKLISELVLNGSSSKSLTPYSPERFI